MPSVRWAVRRRANRAIKELNARLKVFIQPFKLTERQVQIDRLVFDRAVLHVANEYARESRAARSRDGEREALRQRHRAVVQRLRLLPHRYSRRPRVSQMLCPIRIGYRNDEALAAVDSSSSVIFVINHCSNMDYVW